MQSVGATFRSGSAETTPQPYYPDPYYRVPVVREGRFNPSALNPSAVKDKRPLRGGAAFRCATVTDLLYSSASRNAKPN